MTQAGLSVSARRGLSVELNYLMPEGSSEVGPRVAMWFDTAAHHLATEFTREFPADGLPSAGLRDPRGGPLGELVREGARCW